MHPNRRQSGFTLIELMVAITIGLLLLAGLSTLFTNNNAAQMEVERANRQVENGRYAMQLMTADLRSAGYYAEFDPEKLAMPAALTDPCSTNIADVRTGIALPVQGYDNTTSITCLTDRKDNTDVVVVRHTQTCVVDAADCEPASAGGPFFQASLCNNSSELGSNLVTNYYQINATNSGFTLHQRDCGVTANTGTPANLRRLLTHIYYIANNSVGSDGIPTLKRAEIVSNGGTLSVQIVPLVEGIENMQIEYGIATSNMASPPVSSGVADKYTANVGQGCADTACVIANWSNVVSVKLNLLSRTLTPSLTYTDNKSYTLGLTADNQPNVIAAANDKYKRHVFSALIGLPNVAGRKN
jgi:type IV pilus assembly protein PilW